MSDLDKENEMKSKSNSLTSQSPNSKRPKILQKYRRESEIGSAKGTTSIETQTEWSWLQDMKLLEKLRHREKLDFDHLADHLDPTRSLDAESEREHYGYESENEDYGSSQAESPSISPKLDGLVESVGPPKILKYLPETKKVDITPPSPTISIPYEPIEDLGQFMKDFNVHLNGGQPCEFCSEPTRPWPSIQSQETMNPDQLYCCNEYQEYVDGLIQYQKEKEKLRENSNEDFRTILNANNKKSKLLAKERDDFRNMQKLLEKQKRLELITSFKQQQIQQQQPTEKTQTQTNRSIPSQAAIKKASIMNDARDITNQMKSINYQLSNLKYIQDGWTVRQNSNVGFEEYDDDANYLSTFRMSDMDLTSQRDLEKPLIVKKYKNGNNCLILFSDGSGSCFYPSGKLALSIVLVSAGMHLVSAFSDEVKPTQIASFDPFGNGSCNFPNGKIRLILSPFGGLELENDGTKKKRWQWWNPDEHVHAPPFQSLVFTLNNQISIRIYSQDRINIDFLAENQICKFKVGSRIKLLKPENIMPTVSKLDVNENYLFKKKNRIDQLFKLLSQSDSSGVLKLPKLTNSYTTSKTKFSEFTTSRSNLKKSNSQRKQSSKFLTVP